uniref:NADH-ubiquinone oxidoreductase chain 4L n=1 Tax=Hirudo medicinalis TaxID=6421 RepID=A0A342KB26_HIRME|nr:NADH dehydrogenase subunit 4L [Hirudo medicinalis]
MLNILIITIPILCIVNVIFHLSYLLMTLLSLEALLLSIMFMMMNMLMVIEMNMPVVCVLILSISVCEASLGLSMLVKMSRLYGNDNLNILCMSKC